VRKQYRAPDLPDLSDLPEPPFEVRTFDGATLTTTSDDWSFRGATDWVNLNFALLPPLSSQLLRSLQCVLLWYAEHRSGMTTTNTFANLNRFFRHSFARRGSAINNITEVDLLNYRAALTLPTDWYLSALRGPLLQWAAMRLPGVSAEAVKLLRQLRLKGNETGKAVLTYDPLDGPFTDIEFQGLFHALITAYERCECSLEQFLMGKLPTHLGIRPAQGCLLKVMDLEKEVGEDGTQRYFLNVPRVKQKQKPRLLFKRRPLIESLGVLFERHIADVVERLKNTESARQDMPLFPARTGAEAHSEFPFHMSAGGFARRLTRLMEELGVISERTGEPLKITMTRFRRTTGSRAAAEGHGEAVIAEILDHSTIGNATIYVQARPDMVERIDKATSAKLAPLAQAFLGRVIKDESCATRTGDPTSRIHDPRYRSCQGSCGKLGFCGLYKPIACYTCRAFEPWSDGPHEEVLDAVLAEQAGHRAAKRDRLAQNLDRTVLAIQDVVQRCTNG